MISELQLQNELKILEGNNENTPVKYSSNKNQQLVELNLNISGEYEETIHSDHNKLLEKSVEFNIEAKIKIKFDNEEEVKKALEENLSIEKLLENNPNVKKLLGDDFSIDDLSIDVSPEATAKRIVDMSLGFLPKYMDKYKNEPNKLQNFFETIKSGIDKGFEEARGILDGMGFLTGDIKDGVDKTYDEVEKLLIEKEELLSSQF